MYTSDMYIIIIYSVYPPKHIPYVYMYNTTYTHTYARTRMLCVVYITAATTHFVFLIINAYAYNRAYYVTMVNFFLITRNLFGRKLKKH